MSITAKSAVESLAACLLGEARGIPWGCWQPAALQGAGAVKAPQPPKALDAVADLVLAPKPKSKPAKKRKRLAAKVAKVRNATSGN
jgi:hypothetical protein